MKVLVTGVAGFIGSFLCRKLIQRGDDVLGIDNFHPYYPRKCKEFNLDLTFLSSGNKPVTFPEAGVKEVLDEFGSLSKLETGVRGSFLFTQGDIVDYDFLKSLFKKHQFEVVIHLAAMAGVPLSLTKAKTFFGFNPKTKIKAGIKKQVEVFMKMPDWYSELETF